MKVINKNNSNKRGIIMKKNIVNKKLWLWGWWQWGYEINTLSKSIELKLNQAKRKHPNVDFPDLANKVRNGSLKPIKQKKENV